ncbi:serine O-acetyltransferase [Blastococcus saxobsidens]|uniref:Serine acetyltransferase n=1 Tax=Blastococcus saxobsidens (strain DD2) TaxID=1146883 RepID=H6RN33_BLASD|nr:serine acetyltransferase [Blastococcus saxobsidens]CCG01386.1 Serine acetyltransferase [Blastococcus saxobsidens DD2]
MTRQPTPSTLHLVREDWLTHNRKLTAPGVHALVVHRLQVSLAQRTGLPARVGRLALHAVNNLLIRNVYGMELYPTTRIGRRLLLPHHVGVLLGRHSVIGDDCVIRQHVTLGQQGGTTYDQPTLGDRVDVGPGATIAGRITVGDDATIGAHALVLRDVPAGATAMVSPARVLPATPGAASAARGAAASS